MTDVFHFYERYSHGTLRLSQCSVIKIAYDYAKVIYSMPIEMFGTFLEARHRICQITVSWKSKKNIGSIFFN